MNSCKGVSDGGESESSAVLKERLGKEGPTGERRGSGN